MVMTESGRMKAEVPNWAPDISCSALPSELVKFESLTFGYDDMAALLKQEKVPRKKLQDLYIHLTSNPYWSAVRILPTAGADFISNHLLKSSLGQKYAKALEIAIPRLKQEDIDEKSYILLSVDDLLSYDPIAETDPSESLRLATVHELLHFAEYIKTQHKYKKALDAITALGITSIRHQPGSLVVSNAQNDYSSLIRREEKIVRRKEKEIAESGTFKGLLSATFN